VTFNKEARETFLRFANSAEAHWSGNFRDLNAAVTRLATLATQGRITEALVGEEVARLTSRWQKLSGQTIPQQYPALQEMLGAAAAELDPFDAVQLDYVLQICRTSKNTSEAGRRLFSVSRQAKANTNDTDRLRKYLARFGLDWEKVKAK
jgi:transcriptional regulatory protein RtcR